MQSGKLLETAPEFDTSSNRVGSGVYPSKPYESPLDATLAAEILNIPIREEEDPVAPKTIGEVVRRSIEHIARANRFLESSAVARIVATSLMQQLKKRGEAAIVVRPDGTVVLRVYYGHSDEPVKVETRARKDAPAVLTTNKSDLPYLDELRAEAESLGVDISHMGRQRRAIHEFLCQYKANIKPCVDEVRVSAMHPSPLPRIGLPPR